MAGGKREDRRRREAFSRLCRRRFFNFIFPKPTVKFFVRASLVALCAWGIFGYLLIPCIIDGESMMPTYGRHGFTFCKSWSYWRSPPQRGDLVIVAFTRNVFLLKRVVALEGETVEFRDGKLYVNGKMQHESYVRYPCRWNWRARVVAPGHCFVIGDNRSQPSPRHHLFGQITVSRIKGQPL